MKGIIVVIYKYELEKISKEFCNTGKMFWWDKDIENELGEKCL